MVWQTEQDFMDIAAAGLNWVRMPIGEARVVVFPWLYILFLIVSFPIPTAYWAIETWPGEPYLEKVSWK